ncbi:UDP-glucose flavonoid 3-O-glucosyltransferase 7-like [Gastrolobium bilobum]|uniref:UDP-glucose flavonoid 3-O-glucosyltransferase 7-like n=1 Tax=Gastrolobium bilobum TaxID=150636 RepID=UPI002AB3142D|nr:UDP-glucose flavonoid 3-O-glucosyltransferase 7-like [Gastrolobium bilobum]
MEKSRALKIYFLPFLAQGHLIPLVHLARLVASRGQQVTIITTPSNAQIFDKTIEEDKALGYHTRVHIIKFPSNQVGLPDGVENLFAASDNQTAGKIHMAAHLMQPQVEAFMKQSPPDILIPDIMFTWSEASAKLLGIPRLVFNPISIFDVCMIEAIKSHPEAFASDSGPYHIPGLPHPLTLPIKPSPGFARVTESLVDAEKGSHGVIVNSFAELDVEYTEHYEKLTGRKVWHIGPTSLMVQKTVPSAVGDEYECLSWLTSKTQDSVVYICFGSLCRLSDEQLFEIASGLESSGHQFLWVVHRKNDGKEEQEWLPEGFEEKMRKENRGMIIKGWAPQPLILNHPSTGGFLTHCGWNAVAEAISAGVPMITMPGFGDQYYNEKLITEVHGFGVEVGAAEWSISPYDAKKKLVSGERIEKAVKRLMDGGEEGRQIRSKAKEMQQKAWKAVQEGGSSHNSLTVLVDHLNSLLPKPAN